MGVIFILKNRKDDIMKMPNGFGSVYKLSGKRRKPWVARKTTGWTWNEGKQKSFPVYQFIGYYETRQEALTALVDYNKDPYDLHMDTITFGELYDRWSDEHFPKVSKSNCQGYRASFMLCDRIKDINIHTIKLDHLQMVVDESGKNYPTLRKLKVMFGLVYDYAVKHEIVDGQKRDMVRYVDIKQAGNPNAYNRKPFSKKEVKMVWNGKDSNEYMSVVLILIYSGVRISELLDLKKTDIHLDDRWFYVGESKTESGVREVPIAEKIVPFIEYWMNKNDCEYLLSTPDGEHFTYRNYYDSYWKPLMESLHVQHRPHDTRHTCVSFLTEAGIDARVIKKIVGHKGQGVTETVYTHLDLPIKLEAINKI